jgi:hypothetical protein
VFTSKKRTVKGLLTAGVEGTLEYLFERGLKQVDSLRSLASAWVANRVSSSSSDKSLSSDTFLGAQGLTTPYSREVRAPYSGTSALEGTSLETFTPVVKIIMNGSS